MHVRHDELCLLSRTGRYPASRAGGKRGPAPPPRPPTRPPGHGGGHRGLVSRALSGCRRALHRPSERGISTPSRTGPTAYAQRDTYVELEFAVGFGTDDEPWL